MQWTIAGAWLLLFIEHVLAPGYKGRAKFMFFAENCRVRRSDLADFEKQLRPILVGKYFWASSTYEHIL